MGAAKMRSIIGAKQLFKNLRNRGSCTTEYPEYSVVVKRLGNLKPNSKLLLYYILTQYALWALAFYCYNTCITIVTGVNSPNTT